MAASHLFSNKKNSKDHQHINFGKHTGAGPWWALPWALPWALIGPCGDRALAGPLQIHKSSYFQPLKTLNIIF